MPDKNSLFKKYAQDEEDKITLSQIYDKLNQCENGGNITSTLFLNNRQQELAKAFIDEYGFRDYIFWGGYYGAERRIVVFIPDWATDEPESYAPLSCLRASWPGAVSQKLTHRDFLGAVMAAGVRRETIGDILPGENSCDIVALSSVAPFLLQNIVSAGRVNVHIEEIPSSDIIPSLQEYRIIRDTVSSLRLDSAVSAGFCLARDKAAALVRSGKIMLNDLECDKPDHSVAAGDVISARGFGKFRISETGTLTKKGRISIVLQKYV